MNESEKKLGQTLVRLYKLVRIQQQVISDLMIGDVAIRQAISISHGLRAALEKNLAQFATDANSRTLRETLEEIDSSIASLQQTFGPWEN